MRVRFLFSATGSKPGKVTGSPLSVAAHVVDHGIRLRISRELNELHRGTITSLLTTLGRGTTKHELASSFGDAKRSLDGRS
jgi:hypothetical protein